MGIPRGFTAGLLAAGLAASACSVSAAATVTFDAAAKTAASDSAVIEAKWVKAKDDQAGLYIQNKTDEPQSVTLKIVGLAAANYDFYVNWGKWAIERQERMREALGPDLPMEEIDPGSVIRDLTSDELANGRKIELAGLVVPVPLIRCLRTAQPRLKEVYDQLGTTIEGEQGRAAWTLQQAEDWARSNMVGDEAYRAAQIFVAPAGAVPQPMEWRKRLTAKGNIQATKTACELMHSARTNMFKVLTDPLLRETVVEALTPVRMEARYYVQKSVPMVEVRITNYCDLAINGTFKVSVPKGWQAKAKKTSFVGLKSGETCSETFRLSRTSKGQPVPSKLSAASTIKVQDARGYAKVNLTRYVELRMAKASGGGK